jgi:hypothetical protein
VSVSPGAWKDAAPSEVAHFRIQNVLYERSFVQTELMVVESGLFWVPPDVTRTPPEMLRVADDSVDRVGQPESDEERGAGLLPMGQAILAVFDFRELVQEAQIVR